MSQSRSSDDHINIVYTGTRRPDIAVDRVNIAHVPMLEARPVDFDHAALRGVAGGGGTLIFSSQNSVQIVAQSGVFDDVNLDGHTIWAVGQNTADAVQRLLGQPARVPGDQRFDGLIAALTEHPPALPMVSFTLAGSTRSLAAVVDDPGERHSVAVYETCPAQNPRLSAAIAADEATWIGLTSPRGVELCLSHLCAMSLSDLSIADLKFAAIGPTTAAAMAAHDVVADVVADPPDKDQMIRQIVAAERQPKTGQ